MEMRLSDHAIDRMLQRKIKHAEVVDAVENGRMCITANHHATFRTRRIKVYAVAMDDTLLIITVGRRDK